MAELYLLQSVIARAGRSASDTHGNSILFEGASAISDAQMKAVGEGYATLARGALMASLQLMAVRISPLPGPGQVTTNRNLHYTYTPKDFVGLNALPANKQMADLQYCVEISKSASRGVKGKIYLRGFCDEDEINTDDEGRLLDLTGDSLQRVDTYSKGLIALFKKGGGRGMVLPGPRRLPSGEYVAPAAFVTSAREVTAVNVERLAKKQLVVARETLDGKRLDLLRLEINAMQRLYNEAKRATPSGAFPEDDTDKLNAIGEDLFERYESSERNRVKVPKVLSGYIKDRK